MLADTALVLCVAICFVCRGSGGLVVIGTAQLVCVAAQLHLTRALVGAYARAQRGRPLRVRWRASARAPRSAPSVESAPAADGGATARLDSLGTRARESARDAPAAAEAPRADAPTRWHPHPADEENAGGWRVVALGTLFGSFGACYWDGLAALHVLGALLPARWRASGSSEVGAFIAAYRRPRVQLCALVQALPNAALLGTLLLAHFTRRPTVRATWPLFQKWRLLGALSAPSHDAVASVPVGVLIASASLSLALALSQVPSWAAALVHPRRWLLGGVVPAAELELGILRKVRLCFEPRQAALDVLCDALARGRTAVRAVHVLRVRVALSAELPIPLAHGPARIFATLLARANADANADAGADADARGGAAHLHAAGRLMEDEAGVALARAVGLSRAVSAVHARANALTDEAAGAFADAACANSTLALLDLSANALGRGAGERLGGALRHASCALRELDVARNRLGAAGGEALGKALGANTSLERLQLSANAIGERGACALAAGLARNGGLRELLLASNAIGDEGAAALAEALRSNGALAMLSLHDNEIGTSGGAALGLALEGNVSLRELRLGRNALGDEGARALGAALRLNVALSALSLRENGLTDAAAGALTSGLRENGTLYRLDLVFNRIGDSGARSLRALLSVNDSLDELDLAYNALSAKGKRELRRAWDENTRVADRLILF
ncbi:hypothetical protein KFE25_001697 [Diacronema lutheri]|uniref:Uncharacterized protein n=1 Tax=Diacronema lutheri TaxID=2081491 RepID=A0A8J6C7M8_DIALT|nr:hypothetical protein KFE25_001697 [Diacronema lutheri]